MGEPRDSVEKPSAGKLLRSDRDFEAAREAARLGNLSYILGYLATGGGVSRAGGDGKTLLHDASDTGQTAIVVELLSAGADIYARCSSGDTPSDLAARNGHHDVLALLLCHPDIAEPPSLRRLNVAAEEPSRSPEPPTTAWGQTAVAASGGGGGGGARNKMRFRSLLRPWRNKASVKSQNATESVPGAAADNQPRLPRKGRGRRPELREDPGAASDAVGSSPTTMAEHPHGAPAAFFVDGHHGWDAGHDSYGYTTCWDEPLRDSRWSADWPSELSPGASYGEAAPGPVQASSREVDLDGRVSPSFRRPFNWWAHQAPCSCPPARAAPPLSRAASPGDPRSHLPIFFPSVQTRSGGVECPASSVDVAYRELPRETWPENNSARGAVQPTEGAPRGTDSRSGNMSDMINTAFYGGNTLPASSNGIAPWNNGGLPEDHTRAGETGVPTTNKAAREQDSPPPGGRSEPLEGETIERSTTGSSSGSSSGSETRSSGDSDNDYLYSGDDTSSSSESGSGEPRDSWSVPEKPSRLSRSFNHSRSLRVFESVDATAFPATRPILAYVTPNGVMPSSSPAVDGTCGFTRDPRHFQAGEADPPYPGEPHFIYGCGGADAGSTSGRQPPWFSTQPMAMMCQEMHAEALALRETSRLESPRKINNGIGALEYGDDTFGQQFDRVSYVQDGDHNISREIRARGPAASRPVPENPVVVTSSPAPTSVQEPSSVL